MASGTGSIPAEAVAEKITACCASIYVASPNGTITLAIPPRKNPEALTGIVVIHSYSGTYKTDLYYLVMRAGNYSGGTSYTSIVNNTGFATSFSFDPQTSELTLSLPSAQKYIRCSVYYQDV